MTNSFDWFRLESFWDYNNGLLYYCRNGTPLDNQKPKEIRVKWPDGTETKEQIVYNKREVYNKEIGDYESVENYNWKLRLFYHGIPLLFDPVGLVVDITE